MRKVTKVQYRIYKFLRRIIGVNLTAAIMGFYLADCIGCNDNGCPACDGTKGSKYNPEPY